MPPCSETYQALVSATASVGTSMSAALAESEAKVAAARTAAALAAKEILRICTPEQTHQTSMPTFGHSGAAESNAFGGFPRFCATVLRKNPKSSGPIYLLLLTRCGRATEPFR